MTEICSGDYYIDTNKQVYEIIAVRPSRDMVTVKKLSDNTISKHSLTWFSLNEFKYIGNNSQLAHSLNK